MDSFTGKEVKYDYYVYAYIRKKDSINGKAGTPYYIGKGIRDRAWVKHRGNLLPSDKNRIIILETNLSDLGACAIERRLIRWYGKVANGTGILHNLTDGGESSEGRIHSKETKIKMSNSAKGKPKSKEHAKKCGLARKGKKSSEETKQLQSVSISAAKKGKSNGHEGMKHTTETRERMKIAQQKLNYKHTDEAKKIMRDMKKGKPWTEARRLAQNKKNKNKEAI